MSRLQFQDRAISLGDTMADFEKFKRLCAGILSADRVEPSKPNEIDGVRVYGYILTSVVVKYARECGYFFRNVKHDEGGRVVIFFDEIGDNEFD